MSAITSHERASIAAPQLAARLASGERITLLDIRDDSSWPITAASAASVHVPIHRVLTDPAGVARELDGSVVVLCNRGMTARPVAATLRGLGVDASFLEGGMRGWITALQSHPVELGVEGLAARQVQRPARGCLSYLLASDGEALVVDPAPDADYYVGLAAELGARVTAVFDTHLHADHLSGARELVALTGATLRLPAASLERGITYADEVEPARDGDRITFGSVTAEAIALPGHTTDMTGLLVGGSALIGGDSLFADGIARPDLERGDPAGARAMARVLHETLHNRVLALGDDVVLLPGHTHPGVVSESLAASLGQVRAQVEELSIADPDAFAEALLAEMPPRPANYEAVIAVNSGSHPFDPELETGGNSCSTR
jgi:glyoxylase-like metal-dependent hydrolase (beta-lactamase superfamily II)/rhodanese-related sulfurtransferase